MKLDYSCARDILLALEELIVLKEDEGAYYSSFVLLNTLCQHQILSKYQKENIIYASLKLKEAGFVTAKFISPTNINDIQFFSITYTGHQYLDSIRKPEVWEDVKKAFAEKPVDMTFNLIQKYVEYRAAKIFDFSLG